MELAVFNTVVEAFHRASHDGGYKWLVKYESAENYNLVYNDQPAGKIDFASGEVSFRVTAIWDDERQVHHLLVRGTKVCNVQELATRLYRAGLKRVCLCIE